MTKPLMSQRVRIPETAAADRAAYRLKHFNLTQAGYDELLAAQDGRCAICMRDNPGQKGWVIDHDHSCCPVGGQRGRSTCGACVRGLLCTPCNTGLGMLRDNVVTLDRAIHYLNRDLDELTIDYSGVVPALFLEPAARTPSQLSEARTEFLERYLERLPVRQKEILLDRFGPGDSFATMAETLSDKYPQNTHHKFRTAMRALIRQIALDDPEWVAHQKATWTGSKPRRNYALELEAATRVVRRHGLVQ